MFYRLLALLLLLAPATAHAEWYEVSTKHFVIISDDTPEHVTQFATDLERYDLAMRVFHNIPDYPVAPVNRVTVYVVRDVDTIGALSSDGVAGFYIPRAGGSVAFTPLRGSDLSGQGRRRPIKSQSLSPIQVLRHEYAHHFMFNNYEAAALPLWFSEGFAELHATAVFEPDGSITFGQMPLYRGGNFVYDAGCSARALLTTSDLQKLTQCRPSDLYAYGWLMTHYFSFSDQGKVQLAAYVDAINKGQPMAKAAEVFGDLRALENTLDRYLKGKQLPAYFVGAAALKIEPPVLRKLTEGEAATINIRIRTKIGVDKESAENIYQRAVRAAAPYPNDAGAQLELVEAAYDAKHYPEVEAAVVRVLAADPKSSKAWLYRGRARMAVAVAAKDVTPATWRDIRRSFVAANKIDANDAEPLIDYYRSFIIAGEPATGNAKAGLYQAIEFSPEDREVRIHAAYAYLTDGDGKNARTMLSSLAYAPHSGELAKEALSIIEQIDAGQLAVAAARLKPFVIDPAGEIEKVNKRRKRSN